MNWDRTPKNALQSNDLPTEFIKWRDIAADRNQWRAICDSKMPNATKETPTSSRQDIWGELKSSQVKLLITNYSFALSKEQQRSQKQELFVIMV
jgi:hypothetical protein